MQTKLWVKYKNNNSTQVSTKECQNVDDFLEACKKKLSPLLDSYAPAQLSLSTTDGGPPLQPDDSITQITGNNAKNPLFITATATSPHLKAYRQQRYKTMSVEASCRKYLDAIALKLAGYYEFHFSFRSGPTIGDVLAARKGKEGEDWGFRRAIKNDQQIDEDGEMVQINKGDPIFPTPLPYIFTPDEWAKLKVLNKNTTKLIHSGNLPSLSNGKPYIVIPHSEFTEEMISFLKTIGVKATLFSSPDDLVVKDEDALSEGSSLV
jgi:hypothetical protein